MTPTDQYRWQETFQHWQKVLVRSRPSDRRMRPEWAYPLRKMVANLPPELVNRMAMDDLYVQDMLLGADELLADRKNRLELAAVTRHPAGEGAAIPPVTVAQAQDDLRKDMSAQTFAFFLEEQEETVAEQYMFKPIWFTHTYTNRRGNSYRAGYEFEVATVGTTVWWLKCLTDYLTHKLTRFPGERHRHHHGHRSHPVTAGEGGLSNGN